MTISRVLNDKGEISSATRQRVLEVVHDLNYRPSRVARSLVTSQTFTIGLIVPDITNPFFAVIVRGAEDIAWEHNYNILLCNTVEKQERESAALQLLEETQVDGVILCSPRLLDGQLFPLLKEYSSVVVFNRPVPDELADVVRIDDLDGGAQAANHLLEIGRRTIACLTGPAHSFSGQARIQGMILAAEAAAYNLRPELRMACMPTWEGGYNATHTLIETYPDIDSLICYNDLVAVGALQACVDLGKRVPEDIAIVGFDDILLARTTRPALTTLRVPTYEVGGKLMRLLLERVQGRPEPKEIVIKPELIIRASTACHQEMGRLGD
jgi:LacI family transcriptional regulator